MRCRVPGPRPCLALERSSFSLCARRIHPCNLRWACSRHRWLTPNAHSLVLVLLFSGIEDLREKREEVNRSIAKDEEEKGAAAYR